MSTGNGPATDPDGGLLGLWEQLDRQYPLEKLDPFQGDGGVRKTPWLKPGDDRTKAWEAKVPTDALHNQDVFNNGPGAFGLNHPLVGDDFNASARRSGGVGTTPAFDPSDQLDIDAGNRRASFQESLSDHWKGRYRGQGKAGIWDMAEDEKRMGSSVGGLRERLADRYQPDVLGDLEGRAAAAKPSANPTRKRGAWSRMFNMKSGFLNPLAWLYQAGKGIGRAFTKRPAPRPQPRPGKVLRERKLNDIEQRYEQYMEAKKGQDAQEKHRRERARLGQMMLGGPLI